MRLRRACLAVALVSVAVSPSHAADAQRVRPNGSGTEPMDAAALTARIDAVLASRWADHGVRTAPVADDGEFLRRACLDLVGKIPTAAEAGDFLDDPGRDKRRALIDRLLDSPAYTTRATELWRQLLLPEADTEDQARAVAGSFEAWLRRKVVEEAGYDRIVRELLTAKLVEPDADRLNGRLDPSPAAYYVAKGGKPENLASGAARVFLGVRLECAQCHDHPFAAWKRAQFWSFAAFFAEVPAQDAQTLAAASRAPKPKHALMIPGTDKVVQAAHLDGAPPAWRPRADAREVLADWVTAPENPYFARALANRVWARFFGLGLIEPVDDLDVDDAPPDLSSLLDGIATQFRLHGYDLKYLIRALTAARAYNLSSAGGPSESSTPLFASMPVRGLSPGQLFDSLTQATGANSPEARERFFERFANRDTRPTESQTTILQALTMMNGAHIAGATSPTTGAVLGAIAKAPFLDTPGRVEALYLATLTRRPTAAERVLVVRYIDQRDDRAQALADVFWALLNGPEFPVSH
jgi:hypothetical protein